MDDSVTVLVTDLDHTLLHPETEQLLQEIPPLLDEWRNRGNTWIIATGRNREHLETFLREQDISPDYYITRSRYIHSGQSEASTDLRNWNRKIAELTKRQQRYTNEWIPALESWAKANELMMESLDGYVMFDSASDAEQAFHYLTDVVADDFKVLRNRDFLIVVPAETGKGNCLKFLCDRIGWRESDLLCVGDGMNDANMLDGDFDFQKAAVANAEPQLKELIKRHDGTILEDVGGVAIERLLRSLLSHPVPEAETPVGSSQSPQEPVNGQLSSPPENQTGEP